MNWQYCQLSRAATPRKNVANFGKLVRDIRDGFVSYRPRYAAVVSEESAIHWVMMSRRLSSGKGESNQL